MTSTPEEIRHLMQEARGEQGPECKPFQRGEDGAQCENRGGPCSVDGERCPCVAVAEVRGEGEAPGTGERMCAECARYNVETLESMTVEWDGAA